jgi:hypothetical protein
MMDPVTAFGLASNILQFIDSGTKFVQFASRIYHGKDAAYEDWLKLTENLDTILFRLECPESDDAKKIDSGAGKGISDLALDCRKTAGKLLSIIQRVKPAGTARKRDAVKTAFRLTCKEDEIKSLQDRLSSFRNQLNLHLLLSLR